MARIMGIDYGDARVGLAFSDITGFLVGETFTLHEKNFERVVDADAKTSADVTPRGITIYRRQHSHRVENQYLL